MTGTNDENANHPQSEQIDMAGFAMTTTVPPAAANEFLTVFSRPEIRDICYSNQKLVLDGYTYIGCRFDHCTLDASSFNYDLIGCVIDPTTVISYGAPVSNIIQLFDIYYPWANQHLPAFFVPLQNRDGSILLWFIGKEY
ncbi:hypothetical protein GALL_327510 [mine drainage metagenome]|uniref:Uncharacterized protein n=1 Tax=mine drainage metagenome TaxID=410659 RepID=A0A1J5R006_9ZZZZ